MEQPALLEMRHISKEFPGVKALDDVSLTVRPGTVHALMGENGAGKSTLMKCLFGIYHKDGGGVGHADLGGVGVNLHIAGAAHQVAVVGEVLQQSDDGGSHTHGVLGHGAGHAAGGDGVLGVLDGVHAEDGDGLAAAVVVAGTPTMTATPPSPPRWTR